MKAFVLAFNDGLDVEQDFLDQLELASFIQNWIFLNPIIFLVSDESVHFLAEAIRKYDPSRWFFITEIAMGANNGLQPPAVWNFINSPQAKNATPNWISQLVSSIPKTPPEPPARAVNPLSRPAKPTPPTLPSTNRPLPSLRKISEALEALKDNKDKK
ncbi:MAG TPA: hypothetical protein VGA01_04700 [Candidatus Binatia bacterium]